MLISSSQNTLLLLQMMLLVVSHFQCLILCIYLRIGSCLACVYRGYYTVARRYEFYVRVARTISREWAQRTSEILFLPREHKIHIFEPPCNVLFIIWRLNKREREKPIQQKQKAGIVTSLNDTTLTKVTYGKYATRVPGEVAYGIYEWFSSQ